MKWYGKIGYATTIETSPGVWIEAIDERSHIGDMTRNSRRLTTGEGLNDDVLINNTISIVADPFASENFWAMRYAEFMNAKWKITNVEVEYPRLILTLGGVYNE